MELLKKLKNVFNNNKDIEIYNKGLEKARKEFVSELALLSKKYKNINENYFEELENILIMADIGINTVMDFVTKLKDRIKKEHIINPEELKEIIVDELFIIYVNEDILQSGLIKNDNGPTVYLFVGVNGVGKTTTIGKTAYMLKQNNNKVMLIAGDTFRAGAIEQLIAWGEKTDCFVMTKDCDSDPASVIYEGLDKAIGENYDYVLIDTAGRLQNKVNLMKELEKINKVITNKIGSKPHEVLLVIDATCGQNGINQAESFKEVADITGIILTKLDGTAKGGIVLAIKEKLNIPVKYVGLGEKIDDLKVFDIESYIYGLFKDF